MKYDFIYSTENDKVAVYKVYYRNNVEDHRILLREFPNTEKATAFVQVQRDLIDLFGEKE
jgi:hypothetical protein